MMPALQDIVLAKPKMCFPAPDLFVPASKDSQARLRRLSPYDSVMSAERHSPQDVGSPLEDSVASG
jgi:hypothetical protein